MTQWCYRLCRWLGDYLEQSLLVQAVATLVSLPILISWGLGVSYATVVGNILGLPLLALFLIGSSLLWCAALVGLRFPPVAWLLDMLTELVQWLLAHGSVDWLVYTVCPSVSVRVVGMVLLGAVLWYTKPWPTWWRIGTYSMLSLCLMGGLQLQRWWTVRPHEADLIVPKLAIALQPNGLALDDFGFASRTKRPEQLIEYSLRSFLARQYGTVGLACWTVHRVNKTSLCAAAAVCATCCVSRVRLPFFDTLPNPGAWRAYFDLLRICKERGTVLERFTQSSSRAKRQADAAVAAYLQESVAQHCTMVVLDDICLLSE